MSNVIIIDTSSNKEIKVGLRRGEQEEILVQEVTKQKAQVVLPMIDSLLEKHKLTHKDLTGISVNLGPGSFTGLRVGVSIANTLGLFLNVPINGQTPGKIVEPVYS